MTTIHICRGVNRRFQGMVRGSGYRRWTPAGPERRSKNRAAADMMRAFLTGRYKRGMVLFSSDYYDPVPIMEIYR